MRSEERIASVPLREGMHQRTRPHIGRRRAFLKAFLPLFYPVQARASAPQIPGAEDGFLHRHGHPDTHLRCPDAHVRIATTTDRAASLHPDHPICTVTCSGGRPVMVASSTSPSATGPTPSGVPV